MSHHVATLKPLFLSEEEAMALLDLCLMSAAETDPVKDRAMMKLTDVVRRYLAEEKEVERPLAIPHLEAVVASLSPRRAAARSLDRRSPLALLKD